MCQILIECGARVNSFIQTSAVSGYWETSFSPIFYLSK
jgi:hypothetical protein